MNDKMTKRSITTTREFGKQKFYEYQRGVRERRLEMSQEHAIYAKKYGEGLWAVMETSDDVDEFIGWLITDCENIEKEDENEDRQAGTQASKVL